MFKSVNARMIAAFLAGMFMATVAYVFGQFSNLTANEDFTKIDKLAVGELIVTDGNGGVVMKVIDGDPTIGLLRDGKVYATIATSTKDNTTTPGLILDDNNGNTLRLTALDSLNTSTSTTTRRTPAIAETTVMSGTIVVEVLGKEYDRVDDNLRCVSADVKLPNGAKIHAVFSNPPTPSLFEIYDKIRIKKSGAKYEFIEHVP